VAAAIVACARRPRRSIVVGGTGRLLMVAHRIAPRAAEWGVARASAALLVRPDEAPASSGGVFEWKEPPQEHGGWRRAGARRRLGRAFGLALSSRGP